ncbi:MAG: sugar kinase [Pseudomonadota bacterium]
MPRLLSIGECMIELAPTEEETFSMGFAGDTFNTAWYARRLASADTQVAYLSAIGDDEPSDRMRAFMEDAGIVPELAARARRSVGLYMISLKDGERSFSYWRSASAAPTLADDLERLPCKPGDIAFFSGITMAILDDTARKRFLSVLAEARTTGVQIAFDPNLRPRLWPDTATMCDWIMQAAHVADIALPSFEDEQGYFTDANIRATADRYASAGATTVVVKDGPGPVLLRHDGTEATVPPSPVAKVVDTTAAGDSFNAGFLVGLMEGLSADDAVRQGCELARKVIGARGALVKL